MAVAKAAAGVAISGAGLLLFAAPAFAGVTGSVVPDYPDPLAVGATAVPVTLTITNSSTGVNDSHTITVTNIKHTPSCGDTTQPCAGANIDTGVFTVHNGTGRTGTACAGMSFTAGAPDGSGAVAFAPSGTLTLGPANPGGLAAKCIIDFTVDVLKSPTVDADGATTGIQTDQLGAASFTDGALTVPETGANVVTVNKAAPSIATVQSAGGAIETVLNDTATLTDGLNPTGNVTFKLYPPSDATCSLAPAYTDVDASAPYATSPGFASNTAGVWHWTADYAGDANNLATSSGCTAEPVTITKATPSIATLLSNLGPINTGTSVHDSATLTGATAGAGGSVAYVIYTDAACSVALQGAGVKTVTSHIVPNSDDVLFSTPGTYNWQAVYSGDADNEAATSTCQTETLVVNKAAPSIATVQSAGGPIGTVLTDTATLTGGSSSTGNVTFKLFAPSDATCSLAPAYTVVDGSAPYAATPGFASNAVGVWHWTADYAGDANNVATSSGCTAEPVTITKASPTISTTPTPASGTVGVVLNDTATLSGGSSPTGNVTFKLYPPSDLSCSGAPVFTDTDPSAAYASAVGYMSIVPGTYHWTADYAGDANNNAASSGCQAEPVVITQPVGQYCSPGYWKQPQHFDSYVTYHPTDLFNTVFGVNAFPGKTLVQVLSTGGGGLTAYGRATVGALLNSTSMSSGLTAAQVIAKFVATYNGAPSSGNTNGYYGSANPEFTAPENCPLN